jgi:predicted phage terminase large subunit-like protein
VAFPAWLLGNKPSAQIICVSYAQDLADKLALDCRSLMNSDWYGKVFSTRLSPQRHAVSEFMTESQGVRLATSVGGVVTGRGGEFIIIDDPIKPEEAVSDGRRDAVNEWYDRTLYSRLNNKETGCIIIIMQRLHEDDLVGHLVQQGGWKVLKFPAIAVEDETHEISTCLGQRTVQRRVGEALHPERESLEILENISRTLGEYNFSGQYQQEPAPLGGGMVKQDWFNTFKDGEQPARFDLVFQSWDTAVKATERSDFSVCTTWGKKGENLYLLHVLRRRMEYPELKRAVWEQATRFRAATILIEDKSSGTALIQELIREGLHGVTRYEPKMEKIMRLHSVTSTIENRLVYLPEKEAWLADYLHELTTFPNGKFDDQCDSTSQALDWVKTSCKDYSCGWIKHQAEKIVSEIYGDHVGPCPFCGKRSISHEGSEVHCLDCHKRWDRPIRPHRVTRGDIDD